MEEIYRSEDEMLGGKGKRGGKREERRDGTERIYISLRSYGGVLRVYIY
jgi:hypothetical protein